MSRRRVSPPSSTRRERRQLRAEISRRRRIRGGWIAAAAAVVVLGGVVLGLHFSGSPRDAHGAVVPVAALGQPAPNGTLTTTGGATTTVASLRGTPTLLWFVTTWCSSCQAGTQAMAQTLPKLEADGVRVVEVENYRDLGETGPSMSQFATVLAGREAASTDWTFGTASEELTQAYNPHADLDIYYLINSAGRITFVNSSPASTMPQLLSAAKTLA